MTENIFIPEKFKNLGKIEKIGTGSTSSVYKISGQKDYALKIIECENNDKIFNNALHEIEIMEKTKSCNYVVHIIDKEIINIENQKTVYILEDFVTPFSDFLEENNLSLIQIIKIIENICDAVIECKNKGILHLDLQPKNFFINKNKEAIIGDFSSSSYIKDISKNNTIIGTLAFIAPEVYRNKQCSEQSDIYSIGLNLYCLLNQKYLPFIEKGKDIAIYKRLAGTPFPKIPLIQSNIPELLEIINNACAYDCEKRIPTFEKLKQILHNLSLDIRKKNIENIICYQKRKYSKAETSTFESESINTTSNISSFNEYSNSENTQQIPFDNENITTTLSTYNIENDNYIHSQSAMTFDNDSIASTLSIVEPNGFQNKEKNKQIEISKVHFSAIAPKKFTKGEYTMIDIIMYEESFRNIVDECIKNSDTEVNETKSGTIKIEENTKVKLVLSSPDIQIEDNEEEQIWQGEYLNFNFAVEVPEGYNKKQILFIASIYINDIIATKLKFIAKCSSFFEQKIQVERKDILSAFISYASQDRSKVATIIQGMKKARPDMDIFFDVESLRSGANWEKSLWNEIEKRDMLFLCWSNFARESKWVEAEWKYALEKKGIDCIEPIPIEQPSVCPPPIELNQKHFNDKMLFIIEATK